MTSRASSRASAHAILLALPLIAACSGDGSHLPGAGAGSGAGREVHAVQVGAFDDSLLARRLADSLGMAGWQSYVARSADTPPYRVRVAPSPTAQLTERVALNLRERGVDAMALIDTFAIDPLVEAVRVNGGSHGFSSRVRWLVSPNGRALVVLHDPSGVESEAVPDGFIYASEREGVLLQRDSVWDVAPSPSWNRLVYGKAFAFGVAEGQGDSVPAATWAAIAAAAGVPEDTVRAGSFRISAMAVTNSYARPVLVELEPGDSTAVDFLPVETPLQVSGGWRVRWAPDSMLIALGDSPIRVQDDSPPRNWFTVHRQAGDVRGSISQSRLVPVDWRLGPALDVSVRIDVESARTIRMDGATIASAGGWIRRDGRIVGPGVALAATRDGRFIAALAPRLSAREFESALEPVVYKVSRPK